VQHLGTIGNLGGSGFFAGVIAGASRAAVL
jgi:hypothetical protein